jgi:hypothetical protein
VIAVLSSPILIEVVRYQRRSDVHPGYPAGQVIIGADGKVVQPVDSGSTVTLAVIETADLPSVQQ